MYKVLIADDDLPVRLDLQSLINWEELDLTLIKEAIDGTEVLERVYEMKPDIILLDIEMPVTNGIEVLKRLQEIEYKGEIIILSCHDEFFYVSEALKSGASDYILKHTLSSQKLIYTLKKAIENLEKKTKISNTSYLNEHEKVGVNAIRRIFIQDLVKGHYIKKQEVQIILKSIKNELMLNKLLIAVVKLCDFSKGINSTQESINISIVKEIDKLYTEILSGKKCIHGYINNGKFCFLCDFSDKKSYLEVNNFIYELFKKIQISTFKQFQIETTIGISNMIYDLSKAVEAFNQAESAIEFEFYEGNMRVFHFAETEEYNSDISEFEIAADEFINCDLLFSEEHEVESKINQIYSNIKSKKIIPNAARLFHNYFLGKLRTMIKSLTIKDDLLEHLSPVTLNDSKKQILDLIKKINRTEYLSNSLQMVDDKKIRKAIEFINENYMKDIDLFTVANHINFSPSYFSKIFKEITGMNYINYLCKVRIEKALYNIANSDMKIFEVSQLCGFSNYRYFSKVFKKYTGFSPSEYREKI